MQDNNQYVPEKKAICPSCHQQGTFIFAGEQPVPEVVATELGYSSILLWHCPNCNSTISEQELLDIAS